MSSLPNFAEPSLQKPRRRRRHWPLRPAGSTPEGIDVKSVYTAEDVAGLDFHRQLSGTAAFVCAGPIRPCMSVNQPWTIRQYAGLLATAEDSNAFYRAQSRRGARRASPSLSISPPTAATIPIIRAWGGGMGMAGVAINSIYDMRTLFAGIPLGDMSVSMTMNGAVLPVLALYIVAAEEQGVAQDRADRHDPERHPQGIHGAQHLHLPAAGIRCASSRISSPIRRPICRNSIPSRSPATTCRKPALRRIWNSPIRSPTGSNICAPASPPG